MSTPGSPPEVPAGAAAMAHEKFMVAACQILCGEEKEDNIAKAEQAVKDATAAGAQVSRAPTAQCWTTDAQQMPCVLVARKRAATLYPCSAKSYTVAFVAGFRYKHYIVVYCCGL